MPSASLALATCNSSWHDLPVNAVRAAKWSLLDALGVMMAASGLEPACEAFATLACDAGGRADCTILGRGARVSAPLAALANGALAHALDFEDAYDGAPVHPNAAVVPAALAVAQSRHNVGGQELLTALAVGADLVCRLGLALEADPEHWGWYPPPILGAQGAATAAGRLLGLHPAQMLDAWSLTLCQATCTTEFKRSARSTLRAVRDGFAAQAGVQSALLAKHGVRGFEQPFEGRAGLYGLYAGGHYGAERLLDRLGVVFEGANVSYKPWPSCRGTHAFVQAALAWYAEGLRAQDIARISMEGGPVQQMLGEPVERKRAPATAIDAKFSAPFCVALALARGRVGLDGFLPSALADADVLALAQRASLSLDPASGPRDLVSGTTRLELQNGQMLERRVIHPLGCPAHPLSESQLIDKFRDCAAQAARPLRDTATAQVIDLVLHLENVRDLDRTLFTALQDVEP